MGRYQLPTPTPPCARQPQHNAVGLRDVFCPLAHGGTSATTKSCRTSIETSIFMVFLLGMFCSKSQKIWRLYGEYMDDDITRITMFGWFTMALTGT